MKKTIDSWDNLSPFIKEWIISCLGWSCISWGLFILSCILKIFFGFFPDDSWLLIVGIFCLFAFSICCIVTLFCPTPGKELWDRIKGYPAVKMKMSFGSIDCFHTSLPTDHIPTLSSNTGYFVSTGFSYPLLILCNSFDNDFVFQSSLKQKRLSYATAYDSDIADIDDPSLLFITNDMRLSSDEKTIYCYKLRLLADYEMINALDDLIEIEPTMEFQITFLQHSHLILRLDPIENYPYDEKVYELLGIINERIHPWIDRGSLKLLSEKKISQIKKRMTLKLKLTRPDVKVTAEEKGMSDTDIDRILNEYRAKKASEDKN